MQFSEKRVKDKISSIDASALKWLVRNNVLMFRIIVFAIFLQSLVCKLNARFKVQQNSNAKAATKRSSLSFAT